MEKKILPITIILTQSKTSATFFSCYILISDLVLSQIYPNV